MASLSVLHSFGLKQQISATKCRLHWGSVFTVEAPGAWQVGVADQAPVIISQLGSFSLSVLTAAGVTEVCQR